LKKTESDVPPGKRRGVCFFIPAYRQKQSVYRQDKRTSLNDNIVIMNPLTAAQKYLGIMEGDSSLLYLLQRYAEQIGYLSHIEKSPFSVEAIQSHGPVAVIFPSVEILENAQTLAAALTNNDIPIIVCSSLSDQAKTRELGADYCLLHPLVFESFSAAVNAAVKSQLESRASKNDGRGSSAINPV
jgi:hypothetical protein